MTEEELLALAKTPIKENPKLFPETTVHSFINDLGIKVGIDKVPAGIIYNRYLQWAAINKFKPIGKPKFFNIFKEFFKSPRNRWVRVYMLDATPFDMSDEAYKQLLVQNSRNHAKQMLKKKYEQLVEGGTWAQHAEENLQVRKELIKKLK